MKGSVIGRIYCVKSQHVYPDFLVELIDGSLELHEIKGAHLIDNYIRKRKVDTAKEWSKSRKMNYRSISSIDKIAFLFDSAYSIANAIV